MKLKTLIDIEELIDYMEGSTLTCGTFAHTTDLRNAARDWINLFEKRLRKYRKRLKNTKIFYASDNEYLTEEQLKDKIIITKDVCNWIKHFFNLEDE